MYIHVIGLNSFCCRIENLFLFNPLSTYLQRRISKFCSLGYIKDFFLWGGVSPTPYSTFPVYALHNMFIVYSSGIIMYEIKKNCKCRHIYLHNYFERKSCQIQSLYPKVNSHLAFHHDVSSSTRVPGATRSE